MVHECEQMSTNSNITLFGMIKEYTYGYSNILWIGIEFIKHVGNILLYS